MIVGLDPELAFAYNLNSEIVDLIPSKTLKDYLKSDEYNNTVIIKDPKEYGWSSYPLWSYMQLATLAGCVMEGKDLGNYLDLLAANETNQDNKGLLSMFAEEYKKNNYGKGLPNEIFEYFNEHVYQENGPMTPLEELLFLPVIFKPGDVVSYKKMDGTCEYYIIMQSPDYDKDIFIDNSDETYYALNLDGGEKLFDENNRFPWHAHLLSIYLDKVLDEEIPEKYRKVVDTMRASYIEVQDLKVPIPTGHHSKEEMRKRVERNGIDIDAEFYDIFGMKKAKNP